MKTARERTVKDATLGMAWRALGIALYRQQRLEEAVPALRKACDSELAEAAYDGFFLAMSLHQLGQHDEAKLLLDQVFAWVRENQPKDKLLLSLERGIAGGKL